MSSIVIIGATSGAGMLLAQRLRHSGAVVFAVARSSSKSQDLVAMGCDVRIADAMDSQALYACVSDVPPGTQFISFLGGHLSDGSRLPFEAYRNAIDLAKGADASRFTLISTVGCGSSAGAVLWLFRRLLKDALVVREQAEDYLTGSGLPWTIIRPGALPTRAPPTGKGILCENPHVMGAIHRSDLADVVFRAQQSRQTLEKAFTAVDHTRIWKPYGGNVEIFAP